MNECKFELFNLSKIENLIGATIVIKPKDEDITYGYKIHSHLGNGSVGNVYLLEFLNKKDYVIKISKDSCKKDILNELQIFTYLDKNKNEKIIPIYYGKIENTKQYGIVYNYLGQNNFDVFKINNYNLFSFNNNIDIIKQIIKQLISFNNIIHCDFKGTNIIIDIKNNKIISTITDLGLSNLAIPKKTVLSTNYVTSPESLLTITEYNKCIVNNKDLNIKKHDYFGLFAFILNLFLIKHYWIVLTEYLHTELNIEFKFLASQEASAIYVYIWYKFNNSYSNNESLRNVIHEIENKFPQLQTMNIINFDLYFKLYILPNLNLNLINKEKTLQLYHFLSLLIKFDPEDRPIFEELLNHSFLN